jgi:hypothetical protein
MNIAELPTEVVEALAWPLDFDVKHLPSDALWPTIVPAIEFVPIAGEGAGGGYACLRDRGDILFVDSEGAGGIIAPNLQSLMLLFVCHPYWRDLLKFSGGGSLAEMRRVLPFAEREFYENVPEAREVGVMIRERLNLPASIDVVDTLHSCVSSSQARLKLIAPDGSEFGSLFNRFTTNSNPAWRNA